MATTAASRNLLLAALGILALVPGCGGSDGGSAATTGLSASQAEYMARWVSQAATGSLNRTASLRAAPEPGTLHAFQAGMASVMVNQSATYTLNCESGGRITASANVTGSINDDTGTGVLLISATETISDWRCLPPFVINGDPYISLSGTFSFMNWAPATQQHIGIAGGFKWGTGSADSCQIHLDTNFGSNGSGRTTGTVCSHPIDISF